MGWEQVTISLFRIESEQVKKVLLEYVDIYRLYATRSDKEDFKLFVNGVAQKIAHCLETPFEVPLQWLQ